MELNSLKIVHDIFSILGNNNCQNSRNALPSLSIFPSLFCLPPRTMVRYCLVSLQSLLSQLQYAARISYLQEITLFLEHRGIH